MQLEDALVMTGQMVNTRQKHIWYDYVVDLAVQYKALMTGKGIEQLLLQIVRRETVEDFSQRCALTIAITPSVCNMLMKPFNKVGRNDKIKKKADIESEAVEARVKVMANGFYGSKKTENRGLDYWLKTRYTKLCFTDPNAWVVNEWDTPQDKTTTIQPRPFEVNAAQAWDFLVINEEPKWLWVCNDIQYKKFVAKNQGVFNGVEDGVKYNLIDGLMFTLYDEDVTVTYEQVDKVYLEKTGWEPGNKQTLWEDTVSKAMFILTTYEPKLGYCPGTRVGYETDTFTDDMTFVNGWHAALPYLMKSLKTVSELDLTMTMHAFPQKLQYIQRCPGMNKKKCNYGVVSDGTKCEACQGKGFKVHTSAQDALLLPMPETKDDFIDLEKLIVYKSPPVELIQFQHDYVRSLKDDAYSAVYGSTSQTKVKSGGGATGAMTPVTATEHNNNKENMYDAVAPFAFKTSDMWLFEMSVFIDLAGGNSQDTELMHKFPADLKLKTIDELLGDLLNANASGAPAFLRDGINTDIASQYYEGDEIELQKYEVRHNFFPFNGQAPDEIALNMSSGYVSQYTKVLYANFEAIFAEIDLENPEFYSMTDIQAQWDIVDAKVQDYLDEIQATLAPPMPLGRGLGSPGANDPSGTGAAPGNTGNDPATATPPAPAPAATDTSSTNDAP